MARRGLAQKFGVGVSTTSWQEWVCAALIVLALTGIVWYFYRRLKPRHRPLEHARERSR